MDLICKAKLVVDGHKNADSKGSAYVTVVSRETVRLAINYDVLMGLDTMEEDFHYSYLTVPTSNKFYIIYDT